MQKLQHWRRQIPPAVSFFANTKERKIIFWSILFVFPVYKQSWTPGGILFKSTTNLLFFFLNDFPKILQFISAKWHKKFISSCVIDDKEGW